ncbi:MAG: uroporphyrinogen decarboxylase family protein [bacterium]
MTIEENYYRAIEFNYPKWIPVSASIMPATWSKYREAMEEVVLEYPSIFGDYEKGSRDFDEFEGTYQEGVQTDAWGCVWKNVAPGLDGVVVGNPLPNREDVHSFEPPKEHAGLPHGFMFMRLYYLRGFEELMIDFAEEPPELQILIDKVLSYNLQEIEVFLETKPRIIILGDDLGNQDWLPIHPDKWNKYLKPCYARMFAKCRQAGTLVYLHSDGHILEIIDSLIDCGLDVLNPQVGANGLDNLARVAKGKVAINLDLDRQNFPFWTPEQIDAHIHEAVEKLSLPEGGLLLFAEFEPDVPLANIKAICESLEKYRNYA